MLDSPLIKTFLHNEKYYVYDTNTNLILQVNQNLFLEMEELARHGKEHYSSLSKNTTIYNTIIALMKKGILSPSPIRQVLHPDTPHIKVLAERCINQLILGITNACNFRCRYCHQAEGKVLSSKAVMNEDIAFKSVDFLYEHSMDAQVVAITFYGGEPLLNYKLIKKVVSYANNKFKHKKVFYNLTTNASLMDEAIIDFFVKHDFSVLISLDGNARTQNRHRKYLTNGNDTFNAVWKNVNCIRNKYPQYFDEHIRFNAVILPDENSNEVMEFFTDNGINENYITIRYADMNGIDYSISPILSASVLDNSFLKKEEYKNGIEQFRKKNALPSIWHHNGPCIPAVRRIFVNAEGLFYPCEKIDSDPSCKIGSLKDGLIISNIEKMLNIGRLSAEECKKCWAARFCSTCVYHCVDNGNWSKRKKLIHCNQQKKAALEFLKKYITDVESEKHE